MAKLGLTFVLLFGLVGTFFLAGESSGAVFKKENSIESEVDEIVEAAQPSRRKRDTSSEEFDTTSFAGFDNNDDKEVSKAEFTALLSGHSEFTATEISDAFKRADSNEDGRITFQEWRQWKE